MPVHYIANDPDAGAAAPAMRVQARRPARPSTRSGYSFSNTSPEGLAAPGTPKFLYWQTREAAVATLQAWESFAGPHRAWQGNRRRLALLQDDGEDLNAFYDRTSFSFFHQQIGARTFYSGASTDVVAHEVGHGLLDSIRPDLWSVNFLEVGAFHESFGDCIAMLTALDDLQTRQKLLVQAPTLKKRNFVESFGEHLARGIALAFPGHNAAAPRRGFHAFKYQLPSTLPADGPPGALINEFHSFGMLFNGCFWDLISGLYAAGGQVGEAGLAAAAKKAGKLLVEGARNALVTPRFLQSVGRAMTLADQSLNQGAHRTIIRDAFARHDILLGSNAVIAPTMALAGAAPAGAALARDTQRDLMRRMGAKPGARLATTSVNLFGMKAVRAVQQRSVDLSKLNPLLKGVVAVADEPVLVGASGPRAAVMGALPNAGDTDSEVQAFVQTLLARHRIELPATAAAAKKAAAPMKAAAGARAGAPAATPAPRRAHATHVIRSVGGRKVLQRVRFACYCCGT